MLGLVPPALKPHLIRVLQLKRPPLAGLDVDAVRRGTIRFLDDDAAWKKYEAQTLEERRTYGVGLRNLVVRAQTEAQLKPDGIAGPQYDHLLRSSGAYDATADAELAAYAAAHPPVSLWYPQVNGPSEYVCQGLHQTGGITGNWAQDFCAPGGTVVVASFDCEVTYLSGHDPATGTWRHGRPDRRGDVFGWSVHARRADGTEAFLTHLGTRVVRVGARLKAGQKVGTVGHWPNNPGRSHTHEGITSPRGSADSKRIIRAIAAAPKIPAL